MDKLFIGLCIVLLMLGCKSKQDKTTTPIFNSGEKAVYTINQNGNSIVCCNFYSVNKDTIDFPLSKLMDSCQIVKLETSKDGFISYPETIISENYIGQRSSKKPFKLFDHSGKFIRDIGAIGRGPNEYNALYSEIIDEANNKIYLLPWPNQQILVFDTLGNDLPPIKLCYGTAKATMYLKENVFTILNLPFGEKDAIAFQQTTSGELIQSILAKELATSPDFSNEIFCSHYSNNFNIYLLNFFNRTNDTLYHYDAEKNELAPKFTMNFRTEDIPLHVFYELPEYYLVVISETDKNWRGTTIVTHNHLILIDKQELTARYIRFKNDFFGDVNIGIEHLSFKNDKCVINIDALALKKEIEKSLKSNKNLTPEMRQTLIQFNKNLSEEDNNIIFYERLKNTSKLSM